MAGVEQHSDFREDPFGRLSNTSVFIALTSFGSLAGATEAIDRVRQVHTRVRGKADDGRKYSASEPELLTWVHVALVHSFLSSYQRYSGSPLTRAQRDRYFDEYALVALKLGAREVPRSGKEVGAYLQAMRPQLHATPAALETIAFLMKPPGQSTAERVLYPILAGACVDLLPAWARRELGLPPHQRVQSEIVRRAAGAVGTLMRWGVGKPMSVQWATERMAG
ncbi:MAG TPA: oxygenase MpaB family protein, partial [Candidatus Dormibacteraeota bacterium]|nr:oxygenase MpaB family protein [Candidatus Dormibacteraeota bacterium]